jgi:hypothetical protein
MSRTARTRRGCVRNRRGPPARRTPGGRRRAEMVGKLQFTAGQDTRRHHPSGGASGGERQAGRGQAGGGQGDSGGAVTASGARSPGPPGGHGHVRVRLVGHGRRTGRRGDSFGARSETTDRSTAVVTGQRDDGRAGGTRPDREPTGPVHPALGGCGPVARHHAEGRAEVVCRGAGPPAGHQAADEQRHAGQRHRQRGPALVRGPCLAPRSPRHRRWHAVAAGRRFSSALCCSTTGVAASARATPVGSEPFSTSA